MENKKRAMIDRIKWDVTDNKTLVWKFPYDDISSFTQLIVNESQEVVFLKGGKKIAVFGPGRHTLSSANIPGFSSLMSKPFAGETPFTAEIWFVNKTASLGIKWGTPTPIIIQDPKYKIIVPISGYGQLGIQIKSSDKFLTMIVGTLHEFEVDNFIEKIKSSIIKTTKDSISKALINESVSIFNISSNLVTISESIKSELETQFTAYGIKILDFSIESIHVPDNDPGLEDLRKALSQKAEMDIVGYSYKDKRTFDTLEKASESSNGDLKGLFMQSGAGLGVGMGVGSWIGEKIKETSDNINISSHTISCQHCNNKNTEKSKFCSECGVPLLNLQKGNTIICQECSQYNHKDNKFCTGCGSSLHIDEN